MNAAFITFPGPRGAAGGPARAAEESARTRTTFGSAHVRRAASAGEHSVSRSASVPRCSATTNRRSQPSSAAPISAGPHPGPVSTATFGWARHTLTAGRGSRPCALTTTASSQGSPARANASATEDTAGSTVNFRPRSRSARAIPKNPGSPEARTTASPSCAASASSAGASSPSTTVRAPCGAAVRCLRAPATRVAAASAASARAPSGEPSMPTTVITPRSPTPAWSPRPRGIR